MKVRLAAKVSLLSFALIFICGNLITSRFARFFHNTEAACGQVGLMRSQQKCRKGTSNMLLIIFTPKILEGKASFKDDPRCPPPCMLIKAMW